MRARTASRSRDSGTLTERFHRGHCGRVGHAAVFAILVGALFFALPMRSLAQDASWNDPRVLELVDRARTARASAEVDSTFRSYQASARGYVYFFFDRPDRADRTLVKADQIALDVFWQAPRSTKQVVVGQRDEKLLPTDIRYRGIL